MAGLCEGGNESPGSLKAIYKCELKTNAHLNAVDVARDRYHNLGPRRPERYTNCANQADCIDVDGTAKSSMLWFAELNSVTRVQRRIRREWNVDPPTRKSIYEWDRTLRDNGSLISKTGKHSKGHVAEMTVDQLLHQLKPDDCRKGPNFCDEMIRRIDENPRHVDLLLFSDEATFHVCGKVNRHNCCICGSQNPYILIEHERDSPKVNVCLVMQKNGVIGPFSFMEPTVTGVTYLDMLENLLFRNFRQV
ncbi:hypothetical protein ANN_25878 [Periplaneta americana]|uniref:DUF4817 domain-containing protein n=1 Tax=Periplaneta americana TaxID=6978 RepID=A0ABQ8S4X3_PERAM|nr:hypothetical protein ANN_25878 [Periplaneta americana]